MKGIKCLAVIIFIFGLITILSCVPNQAETKKMQQKIVDLDSKVTKLSNSYDELNTSISNLQVDIADMKKQITKLNSVVDTEIAKITKEQEEKLNQFITDYEKKQKGKISQAKSVETVTTPAGKEAGTKEIKKVESQSIAKGKYYKVKQGETVAEIARKFGVPESKIRQVNSIPRGKEPLANQNIFIPTK